MVCNCPDIRKTNPIQRGATVRQYLNENSQASANNFFRKYQMAKSENESRGRPPFVPTNEQRKLVRLLAGFGIPQADIARQIRPSQDSEDSISVDTMAKYFRAELNGGVTEANAKVAGALFKNATDNNNVAAQIFWLKTRARWKETPQEVTFTDPDGNPIPPPSLADFYATVGFPAVGGRSPVEDADGQ